MISVVVVTYNSIAVVEKCLGSLLLQQCRDPLEIILVDNGSSDGTVDMAREKFPMVTLLENGINLGAAAARNRGIAASRGEWVFTFDCDAVAGTRFFSAIECLSAAEEGSRVGIIQPRIFSADGSKVFSCGITLDIFWRFSDINRGAACENGSDHPWRIDAACSACAGYRRKMLEEIKEEYGYFDERFFFMVEDVDLGMRAGMLGWKTAYCPGAMAYHSGNASGFSRKERQYLCWRNRNLMLRKVKKTLLRACAAALCYDFPRDIALFFGNAYMRRAVLTGRCEIPAVTGKAAKAAKD
ncbi:MAG: glycosyltransferase family 2 protein [Candidatus Omnitrophota bacterium]|jgi:hypothetical protein